LKNEEFLQRIRATLETCIEVLNHFKAPYIMIGGVARALLTEPRATDDVDVSVWLEDDDQIPELVAAFAAKGIKPSEKGYLKFAVFNRVLFLVDTQSNVEIDIGLAVMPFEEQAIKNPVKISLGGGKLKTYVPSAENFIVMKAIANRLKDHADIDSVLSHQSNLDAAHIRRWTREYARLMDSPDIAAKVEELLIKHGYGKNSKKNKPGLTRRRRKK